MICELPQMLQWEFGWIMAFTWSNKCIILVYKKKCRSVFKSSHTSVFFNAKYSVIFLAHGSWLWVYMYHKHFHVAIFQVIWAWFLLVALAISCHIQKEGQAETLLITSVSMGWLVSMVGQCGLRDMIWIFIFMFTCYALFCFRSILFCMWALLDRSHLWIFSALLPQLFHLTCTLGERCWRECLKAAVRQQSTLTVTPKGLQ